MKSIAAVRKFALATSRKLDRILLALVLGAGSCMAAEVTKTIAAKSFIQKIDIAGPGQCAGPLATLLASFTNCNFSENPQTASPSSKDFRLYSQVSATVSCDGERVAKWSFTPVETKFGTELNVFNATGSVKEPVSTVPTKSGMSSQAKVTYAYAIKGRPPEAAEPAFQAVKPRTCQYIWHRVEGEISCKAGNPVITAKVSGSGFPSHRAWVDDKRTDNLEQGSFMKLWECSASDPTLIR